MEFLFSRAFPCTLSIFSILMQNPCPSGGLTQAQELIQQVQSSVPVFDDSTSTWISSDLKTKTRPFTFIYERDTNEESSAETNISWVGPVIRRLEDGTIESALSSFRESPTTKKQPQKKQLPDPKLTIHPASPVVLEKSKIYYALKGRFQGLGDNNLEDVIEISGQMLAVMPASVDDFERYGIQSIHEVYTSLKDSSKIDSAIQSLDRYIDCWLQSDHSTSFPGELCSTLSIAIVGADKYAEMKEKVQGYLFNSALSFMVENNLQPFEEFLNNSKQVLSKENLEKNDVKEGSQEAQQISEFINLLERFTNFTSGHQKIQEGNYSEAINSFAEALLDTKDEQLNKRLLHIITKVLDSVIDDKAETVTDKLIEWGEQYSALEPNSDEALIMLRHAYMRTKNFPRLADVAKRMAEISRASGMEANYFEESIRAVNMRRLSLPARESLNPENTTIKELISLLRELREEIETQQSLLGEDYKRILASLDFELGSIIYYLPTHENEGLEILERAYNLDATNTSDLYIYTRILFSNEDKSLRNKVQRILEKLKGSSEQAEQFKTLLEGEENSKFLDFCNQILSKRNRGKGFAR